MKLSLLLIGSVRFSSSFITNLVGYTSQAYNSNYCINTVASNLLQNGVCGQATLSSGLYNAVLICNSQSTSSAWSLTIYSSYDVDCIFTSLVSGLASGASCYYTSSLSYTPVFFSVDCSGTATYSPAPSPYPSFRPSVAPTFVSTITPSISLAPSNTFAPSTTFMTKYQLYSNSSCSASTLIADGVVLNRQCFSAFLNQGGVFNYVYGKVACVSNSLSSSWTVTFYDTSCVTPTGQTFSGSGTSCPIGSLNEGNVSLEVNCAYSTAVPTITPTLSPSAKVATIVAANFNSSTCANPVSASLFTLNRCSQITLATGSYLVNVTCETSGEWNMDVYGVSSYGCIINAFLGNYSGNSSACSSWPYSVFGSGFVRYAIYCFEQRSVSPSVSPTAHPTAIPSHVPSAVPTFTAVPSTIPTFVPTIPPSTTAPSTRIPSSLAPSRYPTRAPSTTHTQHSLVTIYSSSQCSDVASFLASAVFTTSSSTCTSTSNFSLLSSYSINYQSATLQCTSNSSESGWILDFYSSSACSGQVADTFIGSSGGCKCVSSVNNKVSANPLRIVVDCGAGKAASTTTTALVTAACSSTSSSSPSSGTVTVSGSALAGVIFASLIGLVFCCGFGLWVYCKAHYLRIGIAHFSDQEDSLNGRLPQATLPIQAMLYHPDDDIELPQVTRIELVAPGEMPSDAIFVESEFIQVEDFVVGGGANNQSFDIEGGEVKNDDEIVDFLSPSGSSRAARRNNNGSFIDSLEEEGPSPRPQSRNRHRKSRIGSTIRGNVRIWQEDGIMSTPQSSPPRSLLQASTARNNASHGSLRTLSFSTDSNTSPSAVTGVVRIVGNSDGRVIPPISTSSSDGDGDG